MKSLGGITPFGEALANVLKQRGMDRKIREHELLDQWEAVVGKAVANYAQPKSFIDGVLYLTVLNAAWRHELTLLRTELIRAINEKLGVELVKEIILK